MAQTQAATQPMPPLAVARTPLNPFGLRYGERYVVSYTGTAVYRPDIGGFGVMQIAGTNGLLRRIDGHEKVIQLFDDQLDMAKPWELTSKELQVLPLIVEGLTNPEIADLLRVPTKDIDTLVRHISKKLAARNRINLAVKAVKLGLLEADHG